MEKWGLFERVPEICRFYAYFSCWEDTNLQFWIMSDLQEVWKAICSKCTVFCHAFSLPVVWVETLNALWEFSWISDTRILYDFSRLNKTSAHFDLMTGFLKHRIVCAHLNASYEREITEVILVVLLYDEQMLYLKVHFQVHAEIQTPKSNNVLIFIKLRVRV